MSDWKHQLRPIARAIRDEHRVFITLPGHFSFRDHGVYDFDKVLGIFDWSYRDREVVVDLTQCRSANYQALSLVVLYAWYLKSHGCRVQLKYDEGGTGATKMWHLMGAMGLFSVATNTGQNFNGHEYKPLLAIRNQTDFRTALSKAESYSKGFNVEYVNTLRYVITELLYNTLEHGKSYFVWRDKEYRQPSLIQFTWYKRHGEIHFIIADIGIGIRRHLSQTYSGLEDDESAIRMAIRPNVSGTFGVSDPYKSKDNAGVGLYLSTNIVRRLNADMHIVSGNGLLHVTPRDVTSKTLTSNWPGTFVLVRIRIEHEQPFDLHALMAQFRSAAAQEMQKADQIESENTFYVGINNYFGPYAEDKEAGIRFRDKHLLPALESGKQLVLDFAHVESSPHSFLSALLATPIKRLGIKAYKMIKVVNSPPEIRETIDFILDDNTNDI